ncbi:MAG TPA: DUF1345 domain-containing protein [Segetibacter sp.]
MVDLQKPDVFTNLVINRHYRLYVSLLTALVVWLISYNNKVSGQVSFMVTWMAFAFVNIALSWFVILSFHPKQVKAIADQEDSSSSFIFLFVVLAAFISLFAIVFLLQTIPTGSKHGFNMHVLLSLASVFCSWMLIHTLFTLRYAHLYYSSKSAVAITNPALNFPNEPEPDYLDFAYFSFVLGMTFQVSDVAINARRVRRLALLHSFLAFVYNTVIVALSINIVYGIISR